MRSDNNKRGNRGLAVASVALVAGLILAGCDRPDAAAQESATPPPTEVGVFVVEAAPVTLTTELPGRTSPFLIAEIRPQVSGIVKKRHFTEGSEVEAGELLYEIDPATYEAAHATARASLARAEANLEAAQRKAERYQELSGINAISKQASDDAAAALKLAEAEIAAGKAAVSSAAINLDYTELRAPIAGRIGRSAVTAGALVTASQQTSLATVQQLDPIYVDLTQSSTDLLRLKRDLASGRIERANGDTAAVTLVLDDGSTYAHPGELAFSEVSVDPGTSSVTLRAVFPNPDQELLPGMYVRAVIEQGVDRDAILLPHRAITRDPRGTALAMVVGEGDKVEARTLTVERALSEGWLVSDGVAPGDRVIVEGLQRIRPGAQVSVVEAGAEQAAAPR